MNFKRFFPKEPNRYFKGGNKTYYSLKDIRFLSNERLINKYREIKVYSKKFIKARKTHEKFDEKHLIENKLKYSLDYMIRERYLKFLDAFNDLDDALCLIGIFWNLPKYDLLKISSDNVLMSQKLLREFYLYISIAQNFKKGFISIKEIYLNF